MARIIDGKRIAEDIKRDLRSEVEGLREKGTIPGLAALLIGDNPASAVYVRHKTKACDEVGIFSETHRLPDSADEKIVLALIHSLNNNAKIHGVLVQLPLPGHLAVDRILFALSPHKDVDGLHPVNRGLLQQGQAVLAPCTPLAVMELLHRSGVKVEGRHVVILGRSSLVGVPLAMLLLQKSEQANATVTVCHTKSTQLAEIALQADVLIAAIGRPRFVTAGMVKSGAVVVDVGINRMVDSASPAGYRLVGDVDFENVRRVAEAITPVPGGVGPMTIAMLLRNTVTAAKNIMRQ